DKELTDAKAQASEDIEKIRHESEEKMKEAVDNATKAAQETLLKQKDDEISSLEADYHKKLDDLKADYEKQVEDLKNEAIGSASRISSLSADINSKDKELIRAKADYDKKISELTKSHENELKNLKSSSDATIEKVRSDIRKEFEERLSSEKKDKEHAQDELNRVRKQQKSLQEQISSLKADVNTDILTGLKNERALNADIEHFSPETVARISVIGMKRINESQGLIAGNAVLNSIAKELKDAYPGRAYRTLGDQFVIFPDKNITANALEKKLEAVADRLEEEGISIAYGVGRGENAYQDAAGEMQDMKDSIKDSIYSEYDDEDDEDNEPSDGDEDTDGGGADETEAPEPEGTEESDGSDEPDEDDDTDDEDAILAATLAEGEEI
ncbi:MAG: hypothetical protein ACI4CS_05970, partial [Candidatus Weimeria sp.]